MKLNKWQCWIMTIIDSIRGGFPFNYPTSGHEWRDTEVHKNCEVTISECEVCGEIDISWKK